MKLLYAKDLWDEIERLSKYGGKLAAVAYVSSDSAVQFGAGDLLVVDASDNAIGVGKHPPSC